MKFEIRDLSREWLAFNFIDQDEERFFSKIEPEGKLHYLKKQEEGCVNLYHGVGDPAEGEGEEDVVDMADLGSRCSSQQEREQE